MACRNAYRIEKVNIDKRINVNNEELLKEGTVNDRLLFGVDSKVEAYDVLQNNITMFEWVVKNKRFPNFWGRNINGENCLTKDEVNFIHSNGCRVAAIYATNEPQETEEQGLIHAKETVEIALNFGIPEDTAIFLEINENTVVTRAYLLGYSKGLISKGYIPGFKANTDSAYGFDREFSGGLQIDKELFDMCLVWATAPSLKEYERITDAHLIHPDNWIPYAPSGITRRDIAVWQYGKECHPINDDKDKEVFFNANLVCNDRVIIEKMF